jgi:hypothetical protein
MQRTLRTVSNALGFASAYGGRDLIKGVAVNFEPAAHPRCPQLGLQTGE